jgi:hypothetical protein
VPDLPGFIRHIQPVLEQRLAASDLTGHSGELKLTFYRSGLKLVFEQGRLIEVSSWKPEPHGHSGDAAFPELTFLQQLFGYRTRCLRVPRPSEHEAAPALLLFPKQVSDLANINGRRALTSDAGGSAPHVGTAAAVRSSVPLSVIGR